MRWAFVPVDIMCGTWCGMAWRGMGLSVVVVLSVCCGMSCCCGVAFLSCSSEFYALPLPILLAAVLFDIERYAVVGLLFLRLLLHRFISEDYGELYRLLTAVYA
ncbi:hypothetical protein F4861DRAFT_522958 [Xylaria intraflava]|nr:hypothetical protein F4861DRAFT_522958 [Xylaria intraflava]